jgi:2-phosphosulfolactate phosphatase
VLVSSSGTKVIHGAAEADAVYLGCFRNYSALADHLASRHSRVALIGAGSKGEFREEDQMCCGWIGAALADRGYVAASRPTSAVVDRWRHAPPDSCLCSRSVDFLRRTDQMDDLDFILSHIDDLNAVFTVQDGEVQMADRGYALPFGLTLQGRETSPQPFSAAD